ncbi:MAG: class I SAM-dependent methyltransferase, partial [Chloroflexi bacterium]|nr:class I SAM-dependent methyltransferase [Chloroflexota bacterium]
RGRSRFARTRFVRGDGTRLPLRAASVDVVLLIEVLHHVADADAVLREAARVLRPGGRVLIEEVEFTGLGGRVARWVERRIFAGVWPRDRAGLCAGLASHGLRPTVVEEEGFVIVAA